MKVHCLYRDFFLFLRALDLEPDVWGAFERYYFDRNRGFLSTVWFDYQGFTRDNIRERVERIRKKDYADLESGLKLYDIEQETRNVLTHCKSLLHDPRQCNVFLFIGFFSPDAFVLRYGDDIVICIGLERFHSFKSFPVLLSHEYFHYVLKRRCIDGSGFGLSGSGSAGSTRAVASRGAPAASSDSIVSLVDEGLCVHFSRKAYPGRAEHEYCFVTRERLGRLEAEYQSIVERVRRGDIDPQLLFTSHQRAFPGRAGYYVGYRMVADYAGIDDLDDPEQLLAARERIVLDFTVRTN